MTPPVGHPCALDPEAFFAGPAEVTRLQQAGALCGTCPVRTRCLQGAADRRELWGIWGGVLFEGGRPTRSFLPRTETAA